MLASFSVVPIGVGEELGEYIAQVLEMVAVSGLAYKLGAMQTTIEGEPEKVMALIMECHRHLMKSCPRVLTHITIDDRHGATDRLEGKVRDLEEALGKKLSTE